LKTNKLCDKKVFEQNDNKIKQN